MASKIERYEKNREIKRTINNSIIIYFVDGDAYINGLKFINKSSEQQIVLLQILITNQFQSRLKGIKNTGCTWMELATAIDVKRCKGEAVLKHQTSEEHIRQLIFQIRRKARKLTASKNFEVIKEAIKSRYILNEKIVLF